MRIAVTPRMSGLWADVRHGIRILLTKPTASLIAILTLALGIGAATAVFSVVDAVLLRPLPYPEANRLVFLWSTFKSSGHQRGGSALPDYREWRDRNHSFSGLGAFYYDERSLSAGGGPPEQIHAAKVTPSLFLVLGVAPRIGRGFAPEEEQFGKHRVAILSHRLWGRQLGGDPEIVGKQILLGYMLPFGSGGTFGNVFLVGFTWSMERQSLLPQAAAED